MHKKRKQNITLLLCVAPALLTYIVFKLYPAVSGIYYAMTDWNGLNQQYNFIGFKNFIDIMDDKYFWNSIMFTGKYVIVMVTVTNVIALGLAVAIESRKKAKGFFRTLFYTPNMISMVIGGYMWMFIFTRVLYYMALE